MNTATASVTGILDSAQSVNATELSVIETFVQMMNEEVIPSIIEAVEERRNLAADSRQHLLRI